MKRLVNSLLASVLLVAVSLSSSLALAASPDWQLKLSTPASPLTSSNFNVEYKALSVNDDDDFTIRLYMDENLVGTQSTNHTNGNSGVFAVSAADGHHTFHLVAVRDGDNDTKTADTEVTVDSTAPAAPTYHGKTRNGNNYTLSFTAPNSSDVSLIRIYSSASTTFTAGPATQVGVVTVSPGQTRSFSYTASSSAERFHAIRAFDAAGNGSVVVGDPNIVVTVVQGQGGGIVGAVATGAAGDGTGQADENGEVGGTSTTEPSNRRSNQSESGDVLGAETEKSNKNLVVPIVIGVALLALAYYWFLVRNGKSPFSGDKSE